MRSGRHFHLHFVLGASAFSLLAWTGIGAPSAAQEKHVAPDGVHVVSERYTEPKPVKIIPPKFPASERYRGIDGIVEVQLMIDPKGKPYEPEIISTTGNAAFEQSVLKAIEDWRFAPATLSGKPIDASTVIPVHFKDTGRRTIKKDYMARFDEFTKAVSAGDRAAAEASISELEPQNMYETSVLAYAKFVHARMWGTEAQQLEHLRKAVGARKSLGHLPKATFTHALTELFPLEARARDFGAALATWKALNAQKPDADLLSKLKPLADRIEALRHDSNPIVVNGALDAGVWRHLLFRNKFRIKVHSGRISQIKLYCEKKFVLFPFDPALEYTVSSNYGDCSMIAYGDAGTTMDLIQ